MVARIAVRDPARPEAQLQADIYGLLTAGVLQLKGDEVARLEVQTGDGTRRRLDIEVGTCCIEVKKDLRPGNVLEAARNQLAGYVQTQAATFGTRYVGIITDGVSWHLYRLVDGILQPVSLLTAAATEPDALLVWLESVLATQHKLPPTPQQINARLGAESPAHRLDHATLGDLYVKSSKKPQVEVKKELWAKLLRTAFGSAFTDDPSLFIDHTLLVLSAEAIAHAVAGFDLADGNLSPYDLARGTKFHDAQIYGVVEEDFFDWVLDVEGGPQFVADLARRISRFDWFSETRHDVMKVLYTSILPRSAREALGEYYTPDWLADQMVAAIYTDPENQRLLEPSCGSGTFLIHAVRAHLDAIEATGASAGMAVSSVVSHVIGMDVHPVAVILARVSYLLAIGNKRLVDESRGPFAIPVYLGDSIQWEQRSDLLAGIEEITISTQGDDLVQGGGVLFGDELRFPRSVLADASNFDQLVSAMADRATKSSRPAREVMGPVLRQRGVHAAVDQNVLIETFDTMRRLHNSGRNHIWGYYVRNLIRPLWLAEPENRADVLVGNPPWLRYNKMTKAMQARYLTLAKERNLLSGGLGASARDLSTLFVARSVELYLRGHGQFAFVMPHGVLSRRPHAGFRSGKWSAEKWLSQNVEFDEAWDLDKVTTGFPMSSCVVRGSAAQQAVPLPAAVTAWSGQLRNPDVAWQVASSRVTTAPSYILALATGPDLTGSAYRSAFRDGAILYPRYLLFVNEKPNANPLGAGAGRVSVESFRSIQEKQPWKSLPSLVGTVERNFVRDVYLGENVAPFRALAPRRAVLPISNNAILTPAQIEEAPGLAAWWVKVQEAWAQNRKPSEEAPLLARFDYHAQLSSQLPGQAQRVVYSKSGNRLAAARIANPLAVIDHKLYWAATTNVVEARYLVAILNSDVLLARVSPLQARGLFGARDFDKHVFYVPIPTFDASNSSHVALGGLAAIAEEVAAGVPLSPSERFQGSRRRVREALQDAGVAQQIEAVVAVLIPPLE